MATNKTFRFDAYRDTLIGNGNVEITRGVSGNYAWSARTWGDRLLIEARKSGTEKTLTIEQVPHYVLADIARSLTFGGRTAIQVTKITGEKNA